MIAPVRSEEEWRGHVRRGELRRDLAALLWDNREGVAERPLSAGTWRPIPRSRANFMAASAIHQWTLDEIENLAQVVESGDVLDAHLSPVSTAMPWKTPHNPGAHGLASYISTQHLRRGRWRRFLQFQRGWAFPIPRRSSSCSPSRRSSLTPASCSRRPVKTLGVLPHVWEMTLGYGVSSSPPTRRPSLSGIEGPCAWTQGVAVGVAPEGRSARGSPLRGEPGAAGRHGRCCRVEREVLDLIVEGGNHGEIAGISLHQPEHGEEPRRSHLLTSTT